MLNCFTTQKSTHSIPISFVKQKDFPAWLKKQTLTFQNWLSCNGHKNEPGFVSLIPGENHKLAQVVVSLSDLNAFWNPGALPLTLPEATYHFSEDEKDPETKAIIWGLGAYQFSQYKKPLRQAAKLFLPKSYDHNHIINTVESIYMVRDLINVPTDDLGPSEFAKFAKDFAKEFKMDFKQIVGKDLLKQNFPLIYAVGRASDDEPRLIDLRWNKSSKKKKKLTLIGKGICFDTGGLDLKNSSAMLLMKKDMGGAAHVLGLARMIMSANLPIELRVLIPLAENAVSGNAYRPGDVIKSHKGLTVEIGNTDAEGRLVLADALAYAATENPDLMIDIATLTGAARIALGTDLPALFSNHDAFAETLIKEAQQQNDPIWRLPLFSAYKESLNSVIADINNAGADSYGGAITAALFLKEFVPDQIPWMHFDLMAWNLKPRPGRPAGGEAMALRALFSWLEKEII